MKTWIILLTSLVLLLGFSFDSCASTELYFGALSYHLEDDMNNVNPMLLIAQDGWTAGYFYNSYKNDAYIIGKQFWARSDNIAIGVMPSIIHGYPRGKMLGLCDENKNCITAVPAFQVTYDTWKPTLLFGGKFITIAVGYEF